MSPPTLPSTFVPRFFIICLLLGTLLPLLPATTLANGLAADRAGWESGTIADDLTIWVQDGAGVTADDFAVAHGAELSTALEELLLFLNVDAVVRPIEIDVYSDADAYRAAVEEIDRFELDGQIAVAAPEQARIVLPADSFGALTPLDAENQLRHALSHVVTGWATAFNIPRGFDEGMAQYVKRPNLPVQARMAALVQAALQNGKLASWSTLNGDTPIDDDDMERAQSYSMVAYLIRYQGLPDVWALLDALKTADSWQQAMDGAFDSGTASQLERQWRESIPAWAAGDWRWNLMSGFDLEPARAQLARGNFSGATNALAISDQLLRDIDDPARAAEVASLKDQARIGELAETKMTEAQQALETFSYERAAAAVTQAEEQYAQLPPEARPDELLATYKHLAAQGMSAGSALDQAHAQAGNWADYGETRAVALSAGQDFAALGNTERRDDADRLVREMDRSQLRIVLLLGALAGLTFAWLAIWTKTRGPQPLRWK